MTSPGRIEYRTGDATEASRDGAGIITHICNDIGRWGRGFVVAVSRRWPQPEARYRAWHRGEPPAEDEERSGTFQLGEVQYVTVEDGLIIANLIGQHDIRRIGGHPPVRYQAIRAGLEKIAEKARQLDTAVAMPRIGAGLAGGDWKTIETIVENTLAAAGVRTLVYTLKDETAKFAG